MFCEKIHRQIRVKNSPKCQEIVGEFDLLKQYEFIGGIERYQK